MDFFLTPVCVLMAIISFVFRESFSSFLFWLSSLLYALVNFQNILHSSCEVEDFVETHLCNLCVIIRSRVLLGVCSN